MDTKALFIIESPFQLLCAYEAIEAYSIQNFKIYIRLSSAPDNDLQLKHLVTILFKNSKNIKYFFIKGKRKNIKDLYNMIYYNLFFFSISIMYHYIFIGNYKSKVFCLITTFISKTKIVLLDDGIKNILVQNNYKYNIFTMLTSLNPHPKQKIIYNKFNLLKTKIKNHNFIKIDCIIFLGTNISECGQIEQSSYIKLIKYIVKKYNKHIIYIPHRLESKKKIDIIKNLYNISIEKIDYPVELYLYQKSIIPYKIISLYSGALISLKLIYSQIDIVALRFNYQNLHNKKELDLLYSHIKKYIKVENIEL